MRESARCRQVLNSMDAETSAVFSYMGACLHSPPLAPLQQMMAEEQGIDLYNRCAGQLILDATKKEEFREMLLASLKDLL